MHAGIAEDDYVSDERDVEDRVPGHYDVDGEDPRRMRERGRAHLLKRASLNWENCDDVLEVCGLSMVPLERETDELDELVID